ncbi:HprK-related kinase A [Glaciecola sp. SC05]|uniref:HprK-related kinase A n=1 Tax=Glaciecola sp. SC05 TaxID=1987355 RepID=UPI003528BBF2
MKTETFTLSLAPFVFHITSDIALVIENAKRIYQDKFSQQIDDSIYIDYYLSVMKSEGVRKFYKPQARFFCDSREPFKPLNHSQAFAMLEWGMNWTVAAHELQYVIIHSAVLERDGKAIIFPAPPGSGKSTLTAHLANNGWRLLSDEMALVLPHSDTVIPFVRPICLKNQSIALAKTWFPDLIYSSIAKDTHKGDVIHMAPSQEALQQASKPAQIVGIVYPKYDPSAELDIYQLNMRESFMQLVENAFNFTAIGQDSFETVTDLIEKVAVFEICYNNLHEVDVFLQEEIINRGN